MLIDDLLAPVAGDSPTGADLFEDPERQTIELAFEQDAGAVDWRQIVGLITSQCGRTKDVWLAVYLARAGAMMGKLDTIVIGCQLLAGLFETYWDTMFPQLEEYGFQGRKGPCESLTRVGPFLGPLRRTVIISHPRLGNYTGEDLERFQTEGDSADRFGLFRRAVEEIDIDDLKSAMSSLDLIRDAVVRADAVLVAQADGDTGTDFKSTYDVIDTVRRALAPYAGGDVAEIAEDPGIVSDVSAVVRTTGRIDSRDDVIKAIDAITDYYQRREPASPVPVLMRRVRTWVTMDFMSVLNDIAPNSLSEATTVLLAREEKNSSDY